MFLFATCVYLRGNLRVRLVTQRKSLRKFNLRPLAATCRSVWPGLYIHDVILGWVYDVISHLICIFYTSPVPELSFLPAPYIGAEPGRAKEESRITCMRMLRTPPFFPPNRGKNHIWKYFPDLACGAIFWMIIYKQQFLHSDWLKTCQLIPNQWNFTSAALNHIRCVFHPNIKDN